MILILLSWIYVFFITLAIGISIERFLKLFDQNNIVTITFGLFGISLFTGLWAIFFAVNWQFHIVLISLSGISLYFNRLLVWSYMARLKKELRQLSPFFKVVLFFIALFILAQCASPPFIIDNESYYIQTIAWLNNYGFVKGLVNLHLFLGQTSGWHILQSAFSLSFLYENFNDLSGFILLLGNYFAIIKLDSYFKDKSLGHHLIIGLFPIFNVFLFQFISAPSPDVAIYVISLILFYEFISHYKIFNRTAFLSISVLVIFMVFIKLSAIPFILFPAILLIKHAKVAKINLSPLLGIAGLTLIVFVVKNAIVTGNAIYPLASMDIFSANWKLPKVIETYFLDYGNAYGFGLSTEAYKDASALTLIKNWILQPKLHGLFNKFMLALLVVSPWFIFKSKFKQAFFVIYYVAINTMLLLFATSPQYRFYFSFIIIFSLLLIAKVVRKPWLIKSVISFALLLIAIPLFFQLNTNRVTNNDTHQSTSNISIKYIIFPHSNSRYDAAYKPIHVRNTIINSPTEIDFFWGTGAVPPPALNKLQLDYFKTNLKVIPQQRSEDLKDGFYSKFVD